MQPGSIVLTEKVAEMLAEKQLESTNSTSFRSYYVSDDPIKFGDAPLTRRGKSDELWIASHNRRIIPARMVFRIKFKGVRYEDDDNRAFNHYFMFTGLLT